MNIGKQNPFQIWKSTSYSLEKVASIQMFYLKNNKYRQILDKNTRTSANMTCRNKLEKWSAGLQTADWRIKAMLQFLPQLSFA